MMVKQQLLSLLVELEAELKAQKIWSSVQPTQMQLSSQVPFAADVMPFENWLQFIFIPRFHQILTTEVSLPQNMKLAPMAEISFAQNYGNVTEILKKIDSVFAESAL